MGTLKERVRDSLRKTKKIVYGALDQALDKAKDFFLGVHIHVAELDPFKVALNGVWVDGQGTSSQSEEALFSSFFSFFCNVVQAFRPQISKNI